MSARATADPSPIDAVVGHHTNPYASGVARFNELLAGHLRVPVLGLDDAGEAGAPLISLKVRELGDASPALERLLDDEQRRPSCFLHELCGSPLEERLLARSRTLFAGNDQIAAELQARGLDVQPAWAPGLILDHRPFPTPEASVFSFGMAHKMRVDMFARLRELLERSEHSYALFMSNANHASATLREAEEVFAQMREIFPTDLYFLGNLSDVAIHNHLREATFFAAFFQGGVRANNTSVISAMEHGCVVITNLDEHSPPGFVHLENVVDLAQASELPDDPIVLERLRLRAMETARDLSWERLVERMRRALGSSRED